ncbi:MAG TPA: hypothetical protein P5140_08115 [Methanofastidiosum sp.]|nr:hypothetical protein [Methanofastidiosum sp.]
MDAIILLDTGLSVQIIPQDNRIYTEGGPDVSIRQVDSISVIFTPGTPVISSAQTVQTSVSSISVQIVPQDPVIHACQSIIVTVGNISGVIAPESLRVQTGYGTRSIVTTAIIGIDLPSSIAVRDVLGLSIAVKTVSVRVLPQTPSVKATQSITIRQFIPVINFIYPGNPHIIAGISKKVKIDNPFRIVFTAQTPISVIQQYTHITFEQAVLLAITGYGPSISLYTPKTISTQRRLHRSAWQARLGSRLDPIQRKIVDNAILLSAHPTDMLRIRVTRDSRTQDILTRTVTAAEILPIMLPVMKDIPMRRLEKDNDTGRIVCSFSALEDTEPFEVYCPMSGQLQRDDLLFRIIKDPYADYPYIMALQVKDELATIAYSSIYYVKYRVSFYDEPLPYAVVDELVKASEKREMLAW